MTQKIKRHKKSPAKSSAGWKGLKASEVSLEKTGSRLIYAVGTIQNESNRQRFGITVELDLFDSQEKKVGSASDYIALIEPHNEGNFKAMVTDPKAERAEIVSIKEN